MEGTYILRTALKANGFFSVLSGLAAIILGEAVIAINEMAGGKPVYFAFQLFIFALFVLFNAFRKKVSKLMIWIIIGLDFLFVLISSIQLRSLQEISQGGYILIVGSNFLVVIFALFQTIGLLKYIRSQNQIN